MNPSEESRGKEGGEPTPQPAPTPPSSDEHRPLDEADTRAYGVRGPEGRWLPSLPAGFLLAGRYRIVRFIAAGGMGEVYEAEDRALGTDVALKTIRPEVALRERAIERFRREILLARKVTHPNVCRIFDLGHHRGAPATPGAPPDPGVTFLTMELLRGETLDHRLRHAGRMTTDEALPLLLQMASALAAAHGAGIVHRDFKSANVMLVPPRSGEAAPRAVVTDFGLARAAEAESFALTRSDHLVGTPAYMAPEQIEGRELTGAADIYALGVVMYEMVTGRLPFLGDSPLSMALKRFREAPTSPRRHVPGLDARWDEAILRCLERDPADRFASAADVAGAVQGEPVKPGRRRGQRRLMAMAVATALVLATGTSLYVHRLFRDARHGALRGREGPGRPR